LAPARFGWFEDIRYGENRSAGRAACSKNLAIVGTTSPELDRAWRMQHATKRRND
jgi:hypothetical protein